MLKRIATFLLAFGVVLATTLQVIPRASVTAPHATISATMDMAGDCNNPASPCKGLTPACIDSMGCLMTAALPAAPLSASVPVQWAEASYAPATAVLAGVTPDPELFPPILRA